MKRLQQPAVHWVNFSSFLSLPMTLTPHFCVALLSLCPPEKFTDLRSCASVTSQSQSLVAPNEVKTENPPPAPFAMNGVKTRLFTRFIKDWQEVVKRRVLISGRLSTWPILPSISHIRNTLVDVMKFYLPHQLMQHKSIFVQPGRATYITVMTTQSQGGTTNETKCNYCPARHWENKIKATWLFPFGGFKEWDGALLSPVITQRFNWLSCHSAHYDSH